jgi:hypothetical protein
MTVIAGYEIPENLNTPTTLQAQATKVQREFDAALRTIRANTTTTAQAKRKLIAAAFAPVVEEVARIQRLERDNHDRALATTEAAMFGTTPTGTADVIANRDAFDRAESLPFNDDGHRAAGKLLERAEKTHDDALMRAVLIAALDRGWHDIVDTFRQRNTDVGPALTDYVELRKYDPAVAQLPYATYRVTKPSEVHTDNPAALRAIASAPDEAPEQPFSLY